MSIGSLICSFDAGRTCRTALAAAFFFITAGGALADDSNTALELPKAEGVSFHFQSTFIPQAYLPFQPGPFDPANGNGQSTETWTMTGYFGGRGREAHSSSILRPSGGFSCATFPPETSQSPQASAMARLKGAATGRSIPMLHVSILAKLSDLAARKKRSRTISIKSPEKGTSHG